MRTRSGFRSVMGRERVQFHEATGLEARDIGALARTVQLRVLRWFARHGLLDPATAASMRRWCGTGGSSVDGFVRIEDEDRTGLERLVRYCARRPLALERLQAPAGIGALSSPKACVVYRLPEPDVHGRQALRCVFRRSGPPGPDEVDRVFRGMWTPRSGAKRTGGRSVATLG